MNFLDEFDGGAPDDGGREVASASVVCLHCGGKELDEWSA